MSETSPAGEAGSGNGGETDSSIVCPTCGKDGFKSEQYMKIHHSHAHGESIAGEPTECDWCGEEFQKTPSEIEGNNYCSTECYSKGRSDRYSGDGHPRWDGGDVETECEVCGDSYTVPKAKLEDSRFCSVSCRAEWMSDNWTGEDNPRYNSLEVNCETCGVTVYRKPSQYEAMDNVFCSQDCHREYQSKNQVGENHHNYSGGSTDDYGPRWEKRDEECRVRDGYTCQVCGIDQEDHYQALSAHHIQPREEFIDENGVYDHEQGNRLENLITLCTSCHKKWEGIPLRPQ